MFLKNIKKVYDDDRQTRYNKDAVMLCNGAKVVDA